MSLIKNIHLLTVLVSISGFVLRGVWMVMDSPRLNQRWIKILPHVNDTILLITGITLAIHIKQYPFVHDWLTAKIIALMIYIGLGMLTIRHGYSKQQRIITWLAAILVFLYMVGIARTRNAFFLF
ncbi:MAG: SirB2 family protein [Gammaproteobacteria bacterium]|nr:SirB2 family protein [Gammaproteobacteria bacterium]